MQADSNRNHSTQENGDTTSAKAELIRIWDIPTRLFHWSLVSLLVVSCYTGSTGGFYEMDWHMKSGYKATVSEGECPIAVSDHQGLFA